MQHAKVENTVCSWNWLRAENGCPYERFATWTVRLCRLVPKNGCETSSCNGCETSSNPIWSYRYIMIYIYYVCCM